MSGTALPGQKMLSTLLGVPNWSTMTLLNSWVNAGAGTVNAKFRQWQLLNSVEIIGVISSGTITNGTAIATLSPAPATIQVIQVQVTATSGGAPAQDPEIQVQTSGNLNLQNLPTGTTTIAFHGWYSLDA